MYLLAETPGTQTHASAGGWAYPLTRGEIDQRVALFAFLNANRDREKHPAPFEPDWPWPEVPLVSDERRAELMAYLEANSVFNRQE